MRRRSFLAAAAVSCLSLPAQPAASAQPAAALTEIRTYFGCAPGFEAQLKRCFADAGIQARMESVASDTIFCALTFASVGDRNAAWNRVNTLPDWPAVARGFQRYEFALGKVE
jgi:hypothetical protein